MIMLQDKCIFDVFSHAGLRYEIYTSVIYDTIKCSYYEQQENRDLQWVSTMSSNEADDL